MNHYQIIVASGVGILVSYKFFPTPYSGLDCIPIVVCSAIMAGCIFHACYALGTQKGELADAESDDSTDTQDSE